MPGSLLSEVDGSSGTDMPEGIGRCSLNGDVLHFSSDASFTCIKLSYGNGVSFNQGAVVGDWVSDNPTHANARFKGRILAIAPTGVYGDLLQFTGSTKWVIVEVHSWLDSDGMRTKVSDGGTSNTGYADNIFFDNSKELYFTAYANGIDYAGASWANIASGANVELTTHYSSLTNSTPGNHWLVSVSQEDDYGDVNSNAKMSIYSYKDNLWRSNIHDFGANNMDPAFYMTEGDVRCSDANLSDNIDSIWYGYVEDKLFQRENWDGNPDSYPDSSFTWRNRWSVQNCSPETFGQLGVTTTMHYDNTANPQYTDWTHDRQIIVQMWDVSDEDSNIGAWTGQYEFGISPIYKGDQDGIISQLGNLSYQFNNASLNFQVFVRQRDRNMQTGVLQDTDPNYYGGTNTQLYGPLTWYADPFGSDRVTGMRLYFRQVKGTDDRWYKLKNIDFRSGDGMLKWEYANFNSSTTDIMDSSIIDDTDAQTFMTFTWDESGHADSLSNYFVHTGGTTINGKYNFASDQVGANDKPVLYNQSGYLAFRGFLYDPVYVPVPTFGTQEGSALISDLINPESGTRGFRIELLDSNFQLLMKGSTITKTIVSDTDYGVPPPPPTPNWGGGSCNVAEVLFGLDHAKTRQARFYALTHINWFTKLYSKYSMKWAEIVGKYNVLKYIVKPIWNYMAKIGGEYYNNPIGLKRTYNVINSLKEKYPDKFRFYLVGSHARNERSIHDYDIQIEPLDMEEDLELYEKVLKRLYIQNGQRFREDDFRAIDPVICPEFSKIKGWSGDEVYKNRDKIIKMYIYYDKKHSLIDINRHNEYDRMNQLTEHLWEWETEFMPEKYRKKGLDKCVYYSKEI